MERVRNTLVHRKCEAFTDLSNTPGMRPRVSHGRNLQRRQHERASSACLTKALVVGLLGSGHKSISHQLQHKTNTLKLNS